MTQWDAPELYPPDQRLTPLALIRMLARGIPMAVLIFGCLAILLIVRLFERPLFGSNRPLTPWITVFVCRNTLRILGLTYKQRGQRMRGAGAYVANHGSWLDIFTLNAGKPLYFVSKAEVANWPAIGWLARATGTVFINRNRAEAAAQKQVFHDRLLAEHRLLFFPEGTSTDSIRVLPFKPTLFAAFFEDGLREVLQIQPVSVIYHAPKGLDARFYGWWGDMSFGGHLAKVLATPRNGGVEVVYHPPLKVSDFTNRKALAAACETTIRAALSDETDGN